MADGIEEVIAEFEAKMKPVSPADLQMAKGETPAAEAVVEPTGKTKIAEAVVEPTGAEPSCISKGFKELVTVLPSSYASRNIRDLLIEFLKDLPECEG